tara:strand:- start:248 stop:541 length:294 start_codon:yes stop_codon:yes gene_type:complete
VGAVTDALSGDDTFADVGDAGDAGDAGDSAAVLSFDKRVLGTGGYVILESQHADQSSVGGIPQSSVGVGVDDTVLSGLCDHVLNIDGIGFSLDPNKL